MLKVTAVAFGASLVLANPAQAQTMDHSNHGDGAMEGHSMQGHVMTGDTTDEQMQGMDHHSMDDADVSGAEATLTAYRDALVARDADAMTGLFAEQSSMFENGKDEGTFSHYMEHHLGPELDGIKSFAFSEPTLEVIRMGHMAYGKETYLYRLELVDGRVIDREGVATSVLAHDDDGWKIVQYHSSSRAPRNP